jgi:F0F1-type ATP synthase assembly protein I
VADKESPPWGTFLTTGFETAVGVGLGFIVGQWLDKRYGWTPWGTLGGCMLGLAAGMYLLIKAALRANKDDRP